MELTGRQSKILYGVIHEYVTSRVPISSKRILEITNLECSSATIRSEMKTLEGLGYIEQPHTSAGRVPTDKGLRFYVECLKSVRQEATKASAELETVSEFALTNVEDYLQNVTVFLSHWMNGMAVIERPFIDRLRIQRIAISEIAKNYWMVVLMTDMGLAESFLLFLEDSLEASSLEQYLTQKLHGLPLEEVKPLLETIHFQDHTWYDSHYEPLLLFLGKMVQQATQVKYHKHGMEKLIQDDSIPKESLKKFLDFMQNERKLTSLFDELQEDGHSTAINIGREMRREELFDFSLFFTGYRLEDKPIGRIVVFTSKVTDYWDNLKSLQYAGDRLTEYLTKITLMGRSREV
ncbi:MAG TPA: heat-inducible transcriptional repressor HrcA [Thermotogota bacterium]|nr:heat-inducible transcriptional repressor HrcA [Thermotogota bacterium]NLZ12861.1 heat-inducible transcription repressor HrcA [Thermotogaceae bacterium]HNR63643.1 heat-inducible transcriptional repressor HrcA [Thermotogota bacterium]HNT95901.1 heat-inducible transcriptional repressor HrcA [Thermotogota bacterium]HOZ12695.1 heat-inducible transcriptional repressor HrcA [Thermotogota bacterium]